MPPLPDRRDLIHDFHCSSVAGPRGVTQNYWRLGPYYYWENMKEAIQYFIRHCLSCKLKKLIRVKTRAPLAITLARAFLKHFVCIYGTPKAVLTDRGTNFLSDLVKQIAKILNIRQFSTTSFHPQAEESIERGNHVIVEHLKHFVSLQIDWDTQLEIAVFSYNTSVHYYLQDMDYQTTKN